MTRFALALLATAAIAAPAVATTIDFDELTSGIAGNHYQALGVTFNNNFALYANTNTPGQTNPNMVYNSDDFGGSITGQFVGAYLGGVNFLSVLAGDQCCDLDSVTLNGYDASNNLVGTASFSNVSAQTLSISGPGITHFEILQSGLIAIDNFTFTADEQVPEPAMLGLFGLGALGLGLSRRRK